MCPEPSITPQTALLRVLIAGECDGPEIVRKVRDWTNGTIRLDDDSLADTVAALETAGLIERRVGPADKRTGVPRTSFALTATGHTSAVEILAASLTRKS